MFASTWTGKQKAESRERLERIAGVGKPDWLLEIERKKREIEDE